MTRDTQIEQASKGRFTEWGETYSHAFELAFQAGAYWADSHPDSKARNKVLDEVCEWLRSQQFQEYFIERFLKALNYGTDERRD